jgi:hypothetical protein
VISLIHSVSVQARVHDDFQQQLQSVKSLVEIEPKRVAISKADAIAKAIREASGNIIVLMRGGAGDSSEFDVFDDKSVLQAWVSKDAFKAIGPGHEGTGALYSNLSRTTRGALRQPLREQLLRQKEGREEVRALEARCCSLEERTRALEGQVSRASVDQAAAVQQLQLAANRNRERFLVIAAFVVVILFGLYLGYRFVRCC